MSRTVSFVGYDERIDADDVDGVCGICRSVSQRAADEGVYVIQVHVPGKPDALHAVELAKNAADFFDVRCWPIEGVWIVECRMPGEGEWKRVPATYVELEDAKQAAKDVRDAAAREFERMHMPNVIASLIPIRLRTLTLKEIAKLGVS